MSFAGRVSARVGASLNLVFELTRVQCKYSSYGFNQMVGFIPETRELSPNEERLFKASLGYLKAGFALKFERLETPAQVHEFNQWVFAAQHYVEFVLACTREMSEGEGHDRFESPPHPMGRVLTDLEQETVDMAMDYLVRAYTTPAADELVALLAKGAAIVGGDDED
jgi:hypothetical protein